MQRVGIADRFAESGSYADLLDRYGMSVNDIVGAAKRALERKAVAESERMECRNLPPISR
jgi:hypothetical protein